MLFATLSISVTHLHTDISAMLFIRACQPKQYLRMSVTVASRQSGYGPAAQYDFCDCLCNTLGIVSTQCVCIASKIQVASTKYRQEQFLVIGFGADGSPVFGQA